MTLKQMEYIVAIYREGGIHRAAEKLFISQPALSQQLQRVEEEIGTCIFNRSTSPLRPTYAGQHYLDIAEHILYEHQQALIWIDECNHSLHGKLSIGISPARSIQFLPDILPGFRKEYPNIKIEIHEMPMFSFHSMMTSGEIDFALMIAETFASNLTFLPLIRERFFLAVPPQSRANDICCQSMREQGEIQFELLADEAFILLRQGGHLRKIAQDLFNRKKICPNIILETVNADLAYALCGAGYGLTFVSEMCAFSSNANPNPVCYSIDHELKPWILGIAYHPEHYMTSAMATFISYTQKKMSSYPFSCINL